MAPTLKPAKSWLGSGASIGTAVPYTSAITGSSTMSVITGPTGLPCVQLFGHVIEIEPDPINPGIYVDGKPYVPYGQAKKESKDTPLEFEMTDHFRLTLKDGGPDIVVDIEVPFSNGYTLNRRSLHDRRHILAVGGIVMPNIDLGSDVRIVRAKKEGES